MPTPKGTGAPLAPISIVSPGRFGLNKQNDSTVLGPEWATEALNTVFDSNGRLTARKGWLAVTTEAMTGTPVVDVLHEYIRGDGTRTIISSGGNKIWQGTTTPLDFTGTATVTMGDDWQFINFADACIGVQQGEQPIRSTGAAFSDITASAGTAPTGNCGLGAFGRVWIADSDKQTIKYSDLLNELAWSGGSAGSIDMTSVWPNGMDEIVAIAAYNGSMVVFGKNTIVFWRDTEGSALGLNPATIYVSDTIVGTGCIARDTVQQIDNGDLLFLSSNGVQSLQRLIQERSNPIMNVSMNVRDYMLDFVNQEVKSSIRTVYSPREGFYLLILPSSGRVFCFDTRYKLQDGTYRVTEWLTTIKAGARSNDDTIYLSLSNYPGYIGSYTSYNDRDSSGNAISYDYRYVSGWLDLGEDFASYIKMLKTINGTIFTSVAGNIINVIWAFDFESSFNTRDFSFDNSGGFGGEWGVGEWGEMEWGGGSQLQRFNIPGSGAGQYMKIGMVISVDQQAFSLQQLNLYAKIGRLAN
jgi:hypothetical protein